MKNILITFALAMFVLTGCTLSPVKEEVSMKVEYHDGNRTRFPVEVFEQPLVTEIDLSDNQLTGSIPAEIRVMKNLRVLNLSNNLLTGLPAELGQLTNLEVLDVSNNQLTGLPYELGNLKHLKTLNLSGNQYSEQDLAVIMKGLPSTVQIIK